MEQDGKLFFIIFITVFLLIAAMNIPFLYVYVYDDDAVRYTTEYKEGMINGYEEHNITEYDNCIDIIRERGFLETVRNDREYCYSKGYKNGFDNYYGR